MHTDIILVSGLPRSGTSMMMKMLEAGGLPILTDHVRQADEDNPKGYYELEKAKKIKEDSSWLPEARGKAFKIVSQLLYDLPTTEHYRIVFMRRNMNEILASQRRMLERLGKESGVSDEKMGSLYAKHLEQLEKWLSRQSHMEVLQVWYNDILADPQANAQAVNRFLDSRLDEAAMATVVDPSLYRQRKLGS